MNDKELLRRAREEYDRIIGRKRAVKKSWKTTLAGVLAIVGAGISMIATPILDGNPETAPQIAEFFSIAAAGLVGLFARDSDVSSEAAGAK